MPSIIHLDKACPCGSDKTYRNCCAPGGDSETPKQRGDESQNTWVSSLERFVVHFADAINASNGYMIETHDEATLSRAFSRLEVYPDTHTLDPKRGILIQAWDLFRLHRVDADYEQTVDYVCNKAGPEAAHIFAIMENAEFAAWRVDSDDGRRATAIDGRSLNHSLSPAAVVDTTWNDIGEDGVYAGWAVDIDDEPVLFYCVPLGDLATEKLEKLSTEKAWGEGDSFRRHDYEEDILALLIDRECILAQQNRGRVVLSSDVAYFHFELLRVFPKRVADTLYTFGFDPEMTPRRMRKDWKQRVTRFSDPLLQPSYTWACEAARVADLDEPERQKLCDAHRQFALELMDYLPEVLGPKTTQHVVDETQLLSMLHLTPDGDVDHDKAHRWNQYKLNVLDLEPSLLRRARLDPDWPIERALRWAERNADEITFRHLRDATKKHRTAMRFVGIVNLNDECFNPRLGDISYPDLLNGIDTLFPFGTESLTIDDLEDTGRGTWTRIAKALIDQGVSEGPSVHLNELPDTLAVLTEYPGIGETSAQRLWEGVFRYVRDWPETAGYKCLPHEGPAHHEASRELSTGLDELDDLF